MSKSKGFALSESIHNTLAQSLASVSDQGAAMLSLRDRFIAAFGKVKGLKGKPLPEDDLARVRDKLEAEYARRVESGTVKSTSVKALVSTAAKVAECSPVLAAMDAEQFREHCSNWSNTRAFCTALKAANFKVADVKVVAKAADPIKLSARSLKGLLTGKSKHKVHSKGAKAVWALMASRCSINVGSVGEEYFDREEAIKFLGLK